MSVGLLIEYPGTQREARMVPIAAEGLFETYWLPASRLLGLQWVPLFQSGVTVEKETYSAILTELQLLKQFVTSEPRPQLSEGVLSHMVERIDLLMAELKTISNEPNAIAYIG